MRNGQKVKNQRYQNSTLTIRVTIKNIILAIVRNTIE